MGTGSLRNSWFSMQARVVVVVVVVVVVIVVVVVVVVVVAVVVVIFDLHCSALPHTRLKLTPTVLIVALILKYIVYIIYRS